MITTTFDDLETLSLTELEDKIKLLYKIYETCKVNQQKDLLDQLDTYLAERRYRIKKGFVFTPLVVKQIERINKLLTEKSAKLMAKTAFLYEQMKANKRTGDDFLDDYHLEATLDVVYRGENSILTFEPDENAHECDYPSMAEIFSLMPNSVSKPLLRFHLHDPNTLHGPFNIDALLRDVQHWENWEEQWLLRIPELERIPSICNALRGLVVHSNYSLSDILRINDIRCEVSVDWRNHEK